MIKLNNRTIYDDGTVICTESAAVDLLYAGQDLTGVILDDPALAEEFNRATARLDQEFETLYAANEPQLENVDWYSMWQTPREYQMIDVREWCLAKCTTDSQRKRVQLELQLFDQRCMIPVLRHLMWMVDHMRKHKIVWGCG